MDAEHQRIFAQPRRARIIDEPSPLLQQFIAEHGLATPKPAFYSPLAHAEHKCCFPNVEKQVAQMGGNALTGWLFWEVENTAIHTEAHCIWIAQKGSWVDITPQELPPRRVKFSPDDRVAAKRGYTSGYETLLTTN